MDLHKTVESLRVRKKDVLRHFKQKGISDTEMAKFASSVGFPLIVICVFLREEYPEHRERFTKKIKDLCNFYQYEEYDK